jgi:hypothetical protein
MFQSEQEVFHAAVPAAWRSFAQYKARTMQTFDEYLKQHITKADYDNLATKLEITSNKLTRRLKEPGLFTYDELLIIHKMLLNDLRAIDLMDSFEAGIDGCSVREMRLLQVA